MEGLITIMQKKKKIFKTPEDIERSEIDYSKFVYKSSDNKCSDVARFGLLSSFSLKLINGDISINTVKLSMKEFKNNIGRIKSKKVKKESQKKKKKQMSSKC